MATTRWKGRPQPGLKHTHETDPGALLSSLHCSHVSLHHNPSAQHQFHIGYSSYEQQQRLHHSYVTPAQEASAPPYTNPHQTPHSSPTHHALPSTHQFHHLGLYSNGPPYDELPQSLPMIPQPTQQYLTYYQVPPGNQPLHVPLPPIRKSPQSVVVPGPIRATTPLVLEQDDNEVTTISFMYSKNSVQSRYEIRCDIKSIDVKSLSQQHKNQNCVYPRACSGTPYKGKRWQYENECNEVAWALAYLNPVLKGKRGLIQRAVDSWRNSNQDRRLRSRRVRRIATAEKTLRQR